ncbi:MAG: MBOAT family protein [Firmicutes bacterium]|nr:MBOAT family protein [Bacillota bacterium]
MLCSIGVNYLLGLALGHEAPEKRRKAVLILACVFNVGLIGVYKYTGFFMTTASNLMKTQLEIPEIALPLGISFYTFQILSYVIDVYRKEADVQKNPLYLALYISMFPQLVAGPIVRYNDVNREIIQRQVSLDDVADGIYRFMIGLSKKVLLANQLGQLADTIWTTLDLDISTATAWVGLVAYSLQIYYDFGGYSDMAIGMGRMMGFHFNENFNFPYISKSVSEFWRRWHISLGSWFRDYVYIPLGGSRVGRWKGLRNLFVVWALTGLWHGANWTFVLWGLYYGVLICFEKMAKVEQWKVPAPLKHVVCLFLVIMGWVLFRSETVAEAGLYFSRLFGNSEYLMDPTARMYVHDNRYVLVCAIIGAVPAVKWITEKAGAHCWAPVRSLAKGVFVTCALMACTLFLVNATYNPFIYFRF